MKNSLTLKILSIFLALSLALRTSLYATPALAKETEAPVQKRSSYSSLNIDKRELALATNSLVVDGTKSLLDRYKKLPSETLKSYTSLNATVLDGVKSFFNRLFHPFTPTPAPTTILPPAKKEDATIEQTQITNITTPPTPTEPPPTNHPSIVNNTIISGVTREELERRLQALNLELKQEIYNKFTTTNLSTTTPITNNYITYSGGGSTGGSSGVSIYDLQTLQTQIASIQTNGVNPFNQSLNTTSSPTFNKVTASAFYGDGSHLTGISSGGLSTTTLNSLNPIQVGFGNVATGTNASAVGYCNSAGGCRSSALGYRNSASGCYSSAFGYCNIASGYKSSAFGWCNISSANYSSASGWYNTTSGCRSSAFGYLNTASGCYSSASGHYNTASGCFSVSFGANAQATADGALALGAGTASGYYDSDLRTTASGINSVAVGTNSGYYGRANTASGNYSSAFGVGNSASGSLSSAFGLSNTASCCLSSAFGSCNTASGYKSSASGYLSTASGYKSSAFGFGNTASCCRSSAFGLSNTASGLFSSSAFGFGNTASGCQSSAFGLCNTASGPIFSSAFGFCNTASGCQSSAFGRGNTASSSYSSALGSNNTASGCRSSALGFLNTASGCHSSAFGSCLSNAVAWSTLIGPQTSASLHICCSGASTAAFKFCGQTDGTLSLSGGVLTSSSDERLKDLHGNFNRGLSDLANINPILYTWKDSTPYNHSTLYAGFSAQNILTSIPEAISIGADGMYGLNDRPILATVVNAIKELEKREASSTSATQLALSNLELKINSIQSITVFGGGISLGADIVTALQSFGAEVIEGVAYLRNVFVERLTTKEIYTKKIDIKEGFQMTDKISGEIYCVTLQNGDFIKEKGECLDPISNPPPTADPVINLQPTSIPTDPIDATVTISESSSKKGEEENLQTESATDQAASDNSSAQD